MNRARLYMLPNKKIHLNLQPSDLVFIHDDVCDIPKLLKVLSYVGLRDFRCNATDKHTVLLLGLPGGPHSAQCLMLPPLHMLIQACS